MKNTRDRIISVFRREGNLIKLIAFNVILFLLLGVLRIALALSDNGFYYSEILHFLTVPADIDAFIRRPWTALSYAFTHEQVFHVLFNMLFLFWFGRIIQEYIGGKRLVHLYILGSLFGAGLYLLMYNVVPFFIEQRASVTMLGASAAVYAVMVGAAVLLPNYTIFLLFLGPVRIKYIVLVYVVLSFLQTTNANAGGQLAHLGGALAGWLYILQIKSSGGIFGRVRRVFRRKKKKIRVIHLSDEYHEHHRKVSEQEIDRILDKISECGYNSLTKEEKQILFDAGRDD